VRSDLHELDGRHVHAASDRLEEKDLSIVLYAMAKEVVLPRKGKTGL
jgi:hypothetical protein